MTGPYEAKIDITMPAGFEHEFMLFHEGVRGALVESPAGPVPA